MHSCVWVHVCGYGFMQFYHVLYHVTTTTVKLQNCIIIHLDFFIVSTFLLRTSEAEHLSRVFTFTSWSMVIITTLNSLIILILNSCLILVLESIDFFSPKNQLHFLPSLYVK